MENKELLQELEGMKADLLETLKGSTNEAIKDEVKKLEEKFEEAQKEGITADAFKNLSGDVQKLMKDIAVLSIRVKEGVNNNQKTERKSFSEAVNDALQKGDQHANLEKFARGEVKKVGFEINTKAVADFSTANVDGSAFGIQYRPGIITNPNQIGHMRNIIRTAAGDPSALTHYFMREEGVGEGAPAFTSEKKAAAATTVGTGLKPQFDFDFKEASVPYETLAGIMKASKRSLRTIPGILSFINLRVPEKFLDVEDANILYGDGTSPNLKGVLVSGNFTASTTTSSVLAEKITDDIATLEDTYKRMANMIMLRPVDYHSFFKNKAGGSGEYDLPMNVSFVNGVLYISGVPCFKTTALTAGDYVVGDSTGAELLISENMRIEFFEQDDTNVQTNQVTVRIEGTEALPVFGSTYFIKGATS